VIEAFRYLEGSGKFVRCAVEPTSIVRFEEVNDTFFDYPTVAILIDVTEVFVKETLDNILNGCYNEEVEVEDDLY
jgi:hypothetical protein